MIKVLVVGYKGKVGSVLYELLRGKSEFEVYGIDVDESGDVEDVDLMHICYGCRDRGEFVETTVNYIRKFNPALTIINSTVIPTVTEKIFQETGRLIVHSPVRGMHPYLMHDLLHYVKFIGGINREASEMAKRHFESLGMKTYICQGPRETEFAKLLATSYYALLIAWWQEVERICEKHDLDKDQVRAFIRTEEDKPVLFGGIIGGRCLIPNIRLLLKVYDSPFLRGILDSNERQKEEIKLRGEQPRGTIRKDAWRWK